MNESGPTRQIPLNPFSATPQNPFAPKQTPQNPFQPVTNPPVQKKPAAKKDPIINSPAPIARVDERSLGYLNSREEGVEAAIAHFKIGGRQAVTMEAAQRELTSMKIYLNKLFVVNGEAATRTDAETNLAMLRSASFNEAQLRTATELALLSSWIGATKTRAFLGNLAAAGYRLNESGRFEKNGVAEDLRDLLTKEEGGVRTYTSHIKKDWLDEPLLAISTFRTKVTTADATKGLLPLT